MFTLLRRGSYAVGLAVVAAASVYLIFEATSLAPPTWRPSLADTVEAVTFPGWALWISGVAGAGLALVGMLVAVSQIIPPKKGSRTLHNVHKGTDGNTRIAGRAAIGAARHELEQIDGVISAGARLRGKRVDTVLVIDDRASLSDIENQARERLDHSFWIDLGLADFAVNIFVTHHSQQSRVR